MTMRVLCTRIISPVTSGSIEDSAWVRLGGEYIVISVLACPGRRIELQIVGDDVRAPGLWDSEMFMTVDDRLPSNWVAKVGEGGVVELAPRRWLEPGFWEAYFDRDPDAVAAYEDELRQILSEC
ncbi:MULTISPECIES: hypothetical protein [unclassified Frankia]|uniref:hypothetical protein n=1 Tax=unclassified Frankia TaxID=2632575 RepID=UPI002AD4B5F4|nr:MULTISPECIES: hypothetical protein [unclassified Frankia]